MGQGSPDAENVSLPFVSTALRPLDRRDFQRAVAARQAEHQQHGTEGAMLGVDPNFFGGTPKICAPNGDWQEVDIAAHPFGIPNRELRNGSMAADDVCRNLAELGLTLIVTNVNDEARVGTHRGCRSTTFLVQELLPMESEDVIIGREVERVRNR